MPTSSTLHRRALRRKARMLSRYAVAHVALPLPLPHPKARFWVRFCGHASKVLLDSIQARPGFGSIANVWDCLHTQAILGAFAFRKPVSPARHHLLDGVPSVAINPASERAPRKRATMQESRDSQTPLIIDGNAEHERRMAYVRAMLSAER